LFGDTKDSGVTPLRTPNDVVGGLGNVEYRKKTHVAGENSRLYIYSDGVYEVEKPDGSMWWLKDFMEFLQHSGEPDRSKSGHLYDYAGNLKIHGTW
jgi:sigma-B regulation protein RsbU (phosphoserine phosphatase)